MKEKRKTAAGVALLLLGIVFVILGVIRLEHETVLQKAVRVCLECIGIG